MIVLIDKSHGQNNNMNIKKATLISVIVYLSLNIAAQNGNSSIKIITSVVDAYPSLSPDSRQILFQSNRNGVFEIFTMKPDGTDLKQLTYDNVDDNTPSWSPDGRFIVFASGRDNDESDIYIMDADGKNQKRLTNSPGDDSHPHFSPDGTKIIFNSPRNSPDLKADWSRQWHEIFIMNTDGTEQKQITSFKTVSTFPSISPNGKKICFRRVMDTPGVNWDMTTNNRNSEVFIANIDGTNAVNISNNSAFDGWPVWIDDETVLFSSNRGGIPYIGQLFAAKADGSGTIEITPKGESFIQPSVSPDGIFIYAQHNFEQKDYEFGGVAVIKR
jgi:TolB protein